MGVALLVFCRFAPGSQLGAAIPRSKHPSSIVAHHQMWLGGEIRERTARHRRQPDGLPSTTRLNYRRPIDPSEESAGSEQRSPLEKLEISADARSAAGLLNELEDPGIQAIMKPSRHGQA